ncbi:hypothetical protein QQ008_01990 [Fulvivirgaceae bacterium BMA10]|uniref:Arabinogalactan endo-beta-1,4-galactanase n=1 Tax=Splendidivirga corallicola TaxID=3051826 RepID=A0ABT8KK32_9BACT|nr:hypothetical protein [Fulvivirgaceae bacterium BMA10]
MDLKGKIFDVKIFHFIKGSILVFILMGVGCSSDTNVGPDVKLKGDRTLSVDITESEVGGYNLALARGRELGIEDVKLSFDWNLMETSQGFDFSFIDIANTYYPDINIPVSLILRPIDTNRATLPEDITSRPFDDPLVIQRFNALLDSIFNRTPDLTINSILIGNEIDAYLGTDADAWEAFETFFKATRDHTKSLFGESMKVGTIGQLYGLVGDQEVFFKSINQHSDFTAVTYYPLNDDFTVKDPLSIGEDFDNLVSKHGSRSIHFIECGYPSGTLNESSEAMQAEFVAQVFIAWDKHINQVEHITFSWLTDISEQTANEFVQQYGLSGSPFQSQFKEYLWTLGLRSHDGTGRDKPAFIQVRDEARKRGWDI